MYQVRTIDEALKEQEKEVSSRPNSVGIVSLNRATKGPAWKNTYCRNTGALCKSSGSGINPPC